MPHVDHGHGLQGLRGVAIAALLLYCFILILELFRAILDSGVILGKGV